MNLLTVGIGTGLVAFLAKKLKTGKAAYDMGITLEGVRIAKFGAGYAQIGVKFRITNKGNADLIFENYSVKVKYLQTILATGSGTLNDVTIAAHSEGVIEFIINTVNYSAGLLSLLIDLFNPDSGDRKQIAVDYCVKIKHIPNYCNTDIYVL